MGNTIGYGKIGRSIPLQLGKCSSLGGDVEMAATLHKLATDRPDDTFLILGRNSGETAEEAGLPRNVVNPWTEWGWATDLKLYRAKHRLDGGNFSVDQQLKLFDFYEKTMGAVVGSIDDMVIWIGQHGTTNWPKPGIVGKSAGRLTKPQDTSIHYSAPLILAVNLWRDRDPLLLHEVLLNSDVRNYLKCRDFAWPHTMPVLAQHTYSHDVKYERGGRPLTGVERWLDTEVHTQHGHSLWKTKVRVEYARLEVNSLVPGTPFGDTFEFSDEWEGRGRFGVVINETRTYVNSAKSRLAAMRDWILPCNPDWVHGVWSKPSEAELGRTFTPVPVTEYPRKLHEVRCTFTTPASGSGWATAKPWEAFAAGTVCFFHPLYDDQNNILGDAPAELRDWLRVKNPDSLRNRVDLLSRDRDLWTALVKAQRAHFEKAVGDLSYMRRISERLDG
jgi:hypothetical protein